jgi:GrpB-like predicted nucleotidyltransferase (UPF0157 family)
MRDHLGSLERDELNTYLDHVLIGGRETPRLVIAEYDPEWPRRYERERKRIVGALEPGVALAVEHVGSTAVPGLAAKPIVDILMVVRDPDEENVFAPALEQAGYELRVREPGHRMFRTPERDVHVHVWPEGDPEIERYLVFRDRLRSSTEDREAYESLKRELVRQDWEDMNHYADAKSALIDEIVARASGPSRSPRG